MQEYCNGCKCKVDDECMAGYKNPTTTLETANNQAAHKGEWPCFKAPHREQFTHQRERRHQ